MKKWGRIKWMMVLVVFSIGMVFVLSSCEKSPAPPPVTKTKRVNKTEKKLSPPKQEAAPVKKPVYSYNPRGLVDPFKPFIQIGSPGKTVKGVPRTPLQEYDISQLTLTAIVWLGAGNSRALVRDSAGKGFTVRKGTYIGKRGGRVKAIQLDRLIIEEPVRLYGQGKNTRDVVMKMPGEGGKK